MVCLDQSDMDVNLIKAAAEYAKFGKADNIYFVTVVRSLQVPATVNEAYPDLKIPIDERIEDDMRKLIQNECANVSCKFHFDVLEGDPTHQIIKWAQLKEIDLIVLGKKQYHIGKGVTSRNIVNIVHCSALFVTANCSIEPKSILLATDFSEVSHLAYQKAIEIAKAVKSSLTVLHTYEVPTGFHATGKTYDEFEEIMLTHSKEELENFIASEEQYLHEMNTEYLIDTKGRPDKLIEDYASLHHFELVIIGSKGRTSLSSVLLGSIAAKVVESDIDVPILIIKSKEDNLDLVHAILSI
jgi:nucleotide-binding universal stress UspA family protein